MERKERIESLMQSLGERIVLLDGAMGTMIQGYGLAEDDYRGDRFRDSSRDLKGNNDLLTLTRPTIIREIHTASWPSLTSRLLASRVSVQMATRSVPAAHAMLLACSAPRIAQPRSHPM